MPAFPRAQLPILSLSVQEEEASSQRESPGGKQGRGAKGMEGH